MSRPTDNYSNEREKEPAIITQMTQDLSDDEEEQDEENVEHSITATKVPQGEPDSAMNCHFHAKQCFTKSNTGYVGLFDDRELAKSEEGSIAYEQVDLIHHCKTFDQRQVVMGLVLRHWREVLNEPKAADRFEKEYCRYPYWNWNYACSGEVGVYPSNCPNESLNALLKQLVQLNVALPRLLVESLPDLLREDANLRCDPCSIQFPDECSLNCVALSGFFTDNVDLIPVTDNTGNVMGYLGNRGKMIGLPITREWYDSMLAAMRGDAGHFTGKLFNDNTPGAIAARIVHATKYLCYLTFKNGNVVGDCDNCYKHLGWDCPAASLLRDRYGKFDPSITDLRKVPIREGGASYTMANKGNTQRMYTGGLSKDGRRPRQLKPMTSDFKTFLGTLKHETLVSIAIHLRVFPKKTDNDQRSVKQMRSSDILSELICFYDNTTLYRTTTAVDG